MEERLIVLGLSDVVLIMLLVTVGLVFLPQRLYKTMLKHK